MYACKVEDSIKLDAVRYPRIITSASGMASGGRVLHHFHTLLPNHRNIVIFAGFQRASRRFPGARHPR
ncbi:hypothetical protein [Marinobacter psychrophilus]|uniref:hypothetical protein n=1 Tax=Marinobacter psychrophilus TaxID=330734 RepID=UPI0030811EDA